MRQPTCATSVALTLFVLAATLPLANALSSSYGSTYTGTATYYGFTSGGNCAIRAPVPGMYNGMVPVAINGPQYGNSELCGACLRVTGSGQGSGANPVTGTFLAFVNDQCPECAWGALDLGKSGDGRWGISWELVECPNSADPLAFYFEGSNPHYYKMQVRNLRSPATSVKVNGITGRRTQDNFFTFENGGAFPGTVNVEVSTVLGQYHKTSVTGYTGLVYGH